MSCANAGKKLFNIQYCSIRFDGPCFMINAERLQKISILLNKVNLQSPKLL